MGTKAKIAQASDSSAEPGGASPWKRFVVEARPLGLRHDLSFDKIEALLDEVDGPWHR